MDAILDKLRIGHDAKTALRRKNFKEGTARFSLHQNTLRNLNQGVNILNDVKLPKGETIEDWLAVHIVDFYNRMEVFYAIIIETCTPESCPSMSGGKFLYLWQDSKNYKKATKLSAKDYIETLLHWVNEQIHDEMIFPPDTSNDFPPDFKKICQKIFVRLYRVFVHVYIHHFTRLKELKAVAHTNAFYEHFYFFVREHSILEAKDYEPLESLNKKLCEDYDITT